MNTRKKNKSVRPLLLSLGLCLTLSGCAIISNDSLPDVNPVIMNVPDPTAPSMLPSESEMAPAYLDPWNEFLAPDPETEPAIAEVTAPSKEQTEDSYFRIHFLDVGQADAAFVECDGESMMIDAGNVDDSSFIFCFLSGHDIDSLDTLLITHGHEDHCGGAAAVLNAVDVDQIYCSVTDYDSYAFSDFRKYAARQGLEIQIPSEGETFFIGSAQVEILSCNIGSDDNSNSIVSKITYGDTSFLITGDAERDAEEHMLEAGHDLSSTVLKVGHHGSRYGTTYPFLREVMPEFAVISVGANNEYGHPTDDTLSRLRDCGAKVYRTDMQGTISFASDGKKVTVLPERGADLNTMPID